MSGLRRVLRRVMSAFRSGRAERDLAREINAHLRLIEDRFVEQGLTRDDARFAARRAFGGVEQAKELQRDERAFRWLTGWPMDLKLGARMLVKTPGLTVIAVLALSVAIGAGAAYLEFTHDLIRPTLHAGTGRVIGIRLRDVESRESLRRTTHDFTVWRVSTTAIEAFGAARDVDSHLITDDGRTDRVRGVEIRAAAFRLFGTTPLVGRTLLEHDERPTAAPVVVIGHDVWQSRFGADPDVVGRTVRLGSTVYAIVGVMPEGFGFPVNQNLWTPLKLPAAGVKRGEGPALEMFGRLKDGVSVEAAQAELQALLTADVPATLRVEVRPYLDSLLSDDRGSMEAVILYAANLVFVLLLGICGANVATLVFARTAMRDAEIAVRSALGASRGRISAQLFAEALVLCGVGAVAGLAVARFFVRWGVQLWTEVAGEPRPFWWDDTLSVETILYAAALAVFAAFVVGVIPAIKATGVALQGRLREAAAAGSGMTFGRLWTGVIVTQTAITVVVLALVVSLGWTALRGKYSFDVTYAREQLLTADVDRADAVTLNTIIHALRTEPGVVNATSATSVPGTTWEQFRLEFANPEVTAGAKFVTDEPWSEGARVGRDFFETVGIPLVSGRLFTDAETLAAHNVAIVDETFVRTILGGRNAIGVMVRQPATAEGNAAGPWLEIVGVVRDVTVMRDKEPHDAVLYRPLGANTPPPVRLVVRTQGPAPAMAQRMQSVAVSVSPDARIGSVITLSRLADEEALPMRFFLRIFAGIAAVAMLLSTAGIYALISFTLTRRTREIGIRIALGASPRRILTGVLSSAFIQIGLGILAGAIPSVLFLGSGVEDSGKLGTTAGIGATMAVCAFVSLVALISCAAPLRRALRIEPTQALRSA
jgi:putative ABC transport system permease protein